MTERLQEMGKKQATGAQESCRVEREKEMLFAKKLQAAIAMNLTAIARKLRA